MKLLRIVAMLLLVGGIALTGLSTYTYFNNEDKSRAQAYAGEQQKLLAEAFRANGTPRELMKEYEDGKGLTELAWQHARRTSRTIAQLAGSGVAWMVTSFVMISRKRIRSLPA